MPAAASQTRPLHVALCITCLNDAFYPEVGEATVRILRRLGYNVAFPSAQTCCAQPAFNSGFKQAARLVARRNLTIFAGYDYVVVPSGSCTAMLRVFYPELFADDAALAKQAADLAARTYELSEFLVQVAGVEHVATTFRGKVAYHASCHLLRELGVTDAPQRLIRAAAGVDLIPMDLSQQCCGFGGTFAIKYPQISDAMLQKKIASLKRAGADTLVSCDAGCLLHIAGRLRRQNESIRVMHLAELLDHSGTDKGDRHASGH